MMSVTPTELSRTQSFESIPDVGFLEGLVEDEHRAFGEVTEFKAREMSGKMLPEPLLIEDKSRFVLFPIKHPDVKNHLNTHNFKYYLLI